MHIRWRRHLDIPRRRITAMTRLDKNQALIFGIELCSSRILSTIVAFCRSGTKVKNVKNKGGFLCARFLVAIF